MSGWIYFFANKRNGTVYVGVTNNLPRRGYEHREGIVEGFTKKYGAKLLVYAEYYDKIEDAILREKQIKKWRRAWKIELIEKNNPQWKDLYCEYCTL